MATSSSSEIFSHKEPRSSEQLLADLLTAANKGAPQMAPLIGVTRQHLNAVLRGVENLSEAKWRLVANEANVPSQLVLAELQRYKTWISTPEGAERAAELLRSSFVDGYLMRGASWLSETAIKEGIKRTVISARRFGPLGEELPLEIGKDARRDVICHFSHISNEGPSQATIEPGRSIKVVTQEHFAVRSGVELFFNGLLIQLSDEGLIASRPLFSAPKDEQPLDITLFNSSDRPYTLLTPGTRICTVRFYLDPHSDNDETEQQTKNTQ